MSYINEALKKAQELKDSGSLKYYNIPSTGEEGKRNLKIGIFFYSISAILLICLLFFGYRWLHSLYNERELIMATEIRGTGKDDAGGPDKKALYDKALSLYKRGRIMEAKKLYEAVLALDPGYIDALNNLGIINISNRDFNAAEENLKKAVMLSPSFVESYYNLACLYAIKGDTDNGLEYLKKAISIDESVKVWAKNDSDLQDLDKLDEFKRIVEE